MRIHTLGTGHGDSTHARFNSSTVYETQNGTLYLIDAGAPVEALIRRKGLRLQKLRAAFITHMHDDHAGGLTSLMKQVIKYPQERTFPFTLHLPEKKAISALKSWFSVLHENAEDANLAYCAVEDGMVYEDENLLVTAVRTAHLRTLGRFEGDPCSFAYILHFKQEKRTILHTGDLRHDYTDFPNVAAEMHFDLCLTEATHYQPENALPVLMNAQFDKLIFIHIGDRWHDRILPSWRLENGEEQLLQAFSTLPYPIAIAHDSDTFWL